MSCVDCGRRCQGRRCRQCELDRRAEERAERLRNAGDARADLGGAEYQQRELSSFIDMGEEDG